MNKTVAAFDQEEDVVHVAWFGTDGSTHFSQVSCGTEVEDKLRELIRDDVVDVWVTEESKDLIEQLRGLPKKFNFQTVSRLFAIYHSFVDQLNGSPCLVLSVELDSARLGHFHNGILSPENSSPQLSLRRVWRRYISSTRDLERRMKQLKTTHPGADHDAFKDFSCVLRGDKTSRRGLIAFDDKIDLSSSLAEIRKALAPLASEVQRPRHLILSNWAACGNHAELFDKEGYVVHLSLDSPFLDAVRGLLRWKSNQEGQGSSINGRKDGKLAEERLTAADQVVVDCTSCGTRNRVDHRDSKKRPICDQCKKPLPPVLLHQGKTSLTRGDYPEAIRCFDQLLKDDGANNLYQAGRLLAVIKQQKSIEGHEQGIADLRNSADVSGNEKNWLHDILTFAAKEFLEKGDLKSAEDNLEIASAVSPSGEVAVLFGRLRKDQGDQALREDSIGSAKTLYQDAKKKDPVNKNYELYIRHLERMTKIRKRTRLIVLLISLGIISLVFVLGTRSLNAVKERLERELQQQKAGFEAQLANNHVEIERLRKGNEEPIADDGTLKDELVQAKHSAITERLNRRRAETEAAQARARIDSLEEEIRQLNEVVRARQSPLGR